MPSIEKRDTHHVALLGQCDIDEATVIRKELELMIRRAKGEKFTIDFQGLESVSSAILSMMLCCLRIAQAEKCDLAFSNLPPRLYDMARVGGLESMLPLSDHSA